MINPAESQNRKKKIIPIFKNFRRKNVPRPSESAREGDKQTSAPRVQPEGALECKNPARGRFAPSGRVFALECTLGLHARDGNSYRARERQKRRGGGGAVVVAKKSYHDYDLKLTRGPRSFRGTSSVAGRLQVFAPLHPIHCVLMGKWSTCYSEYPSARGGQMEWVPAGKPSPGGRLDMIL